MSRLAFWPVQLLAGVGMGAVGLAMVALLFLMFILFALAASLVAIGCLGLIVGQVIIGRIRVDEIGDIIEDIAADKKAKAPGGL